MPFFDDERDWDEDEEFDDDIDDPILNPDSIDRRALESFIKDSEEGDLDEEEYDTWENLLEEAYQKLIENPSKENLELAERISAYLEINGD